MIIKGKEKKKGKNKSVDKVREQKQLSLDFF